MLLDWSTEPDGPWSPPASWTVDQNQASGTEWRVENGRLTNDSRDNRSAASYLLGPSASSLGALVTFDRRRPLRLRDQGGVMIGAWAWDLRRDWPKLPDSPCHLVVTPTHWIYGVAERGALRIVDRGVFLRRPRAGATPRLHVEIEPGVARLRLPGGVRADVVDPAIQPESAAISCFEVYQQNAARDARGGFVGISASQ